MSKGKNPSFSEEVSALIKKSELPREFPRAVLEEAESLDEIPSEEPKRRLDLRNEIVVTIDGEKARDFDDAVSISKLSDGGYRLCISIADVGFYVAPGSAIDREAFRRGTSVYFPDRVIPMLPERLSNELCSLVPHQDRLTFTAFIDIDSKGRKTGASFARSIIRSAARLTYTAVRKILVDRDPEARRHYHAVVPALEEMGRLSDLIAVRRRERGSLDFDLPEPEIVLDMEEGGIEKIVRAERNKAHRLIEEFMIAANEAVAEFITEQGRPMIYRIHGRPTPEKIKNFSLLLHHLGIPFRTSGRPEPKMFLPVLDKVHGRPEERLVNTLLLRTMERAIYDVHNDGHFGLASGCYTHFTSPIRRYPDLIVHRILARALENEKGYALPQLERISAQATKTERAGMEMEWGVRDLATALFMKDKVGEVHRGIISNVTKFGFFVELTDYFVEGLVPMRSLKDDFYLFQEKSHRLVGKRTKQKFTIGDKVLVMVKGVNLEKRWVDLEITK